MLEFILQAIKVVLPCIAAGAVVCYINVQNAKKQKEIERAQTKNECGDEEINYEIAYPAVIYGIMYACLFFCVICLIFSYLDEQFGWFTGITFGGGAALGLYGVLGSHVWKIWVKGEQIIYRGYNGIKHYYTLSDLTKVTVRSDGALIVYSGKKRLFKIDNNLPMRAILRAQMLDKNIPNDVDGMTIDNFRLKPRMVYYVGTILCGGFFGLILGIIIKQGEFNSIYFIPMLLGLVITGLIFLDLLLDRFAVDGKMVTRRRGLLTKRFSLDDVDYIHTKKDLFRENLEFYIDGKKITHVWVLNQPYELLKRKLCAVGVKTQKNKKKKAKKK